MSKASLTIAKLDCLYESSTIQDSRVSTRFGHIGILNNDNVDICSLGVGLALAASHPNTHHHAHPSSSNQQLNPSADGSVTGLSGSKYAISPLRRAVLTGIKR